MLKVKVNYGIDDETDGGAKGDGEVGDKVKGEVKVSRLRWR